MLWDESMDFEVKIRPLESADAGPDVEDRIIVLPVSSLAMKVSRNPPPPLAA